MIAAFPVLFCSRLNLVSMFSQPDLQVFEQLVNPLEISNLLHKNLHNFLVDNSKEQLFHVLCFSSRQLSWLMN